MTRQGDFGEQSENIDRSRLRLRLPTTFPTPDSCQRVRTSRYQRIRTAQLRGHASLTESTRARSTAKPACRNRPDGSAQPSWLAQRVQRPLAQSCQLDRIGAEALHSQASLNGSARRLSSAKPAWRRCPASAASSCWHAEAVHVRLSHERPWIASAIARALRCPSRIARDARAALGMADVRGAQAVRTFA